MKFFRACLYTVCLGIFAMLIGGYFGALHPALDSLSHLRLYLSVAAVLSGLMLIFFGGFLGGASMVVSGLLIFVTTLGNLGLLRSMATAEPSDGVNYRLLQINLRFDNETPNEVIRLIGSLKPDVIAAEEVSAMWQPKLEGLKHLYPHQFYCASQDFVGGVALLSRRPFVGDGSLGCTNLGAFALQVVDFGGRQVQVGVMHLDWPWPFYQPYLLNDMKSAMKSVALSTLPVLLAGDINAVSWSHAARRIADETETRRADYRGASWLHHSMPIAWAAWIGLPIDHVFADDLDIQNVATQRPVGSDHLPVLVEFSIADRMEKTVDTALAH